MVLLLGLLFYSNDLVVQGLTRKLDMRTMSEADAAAVANLNNAAVGP